MLRKVSEILHPVLLTDSTKQSEVIARFQRLRRMDLSKHRVTKEAAILIPLCLVDGNVSLLYTLRSNSLRNHRGQVSFPGGMKENTDASIEDCALREFEEETGISKSLINVWGCGNPFVPASDLSITPVVANIVDYSFDQLKPNTAEVAKVFTVPIQTYSQTQNRKHTQFRSGYSSPVFLNGPETVWGITAIVTHLFLTALLPDIYDNRLPFLRQYSNQRIEKNDKKL